MFLVQIFDTNTKDIAEIQFEDEFVTLLMESGCTQRLTVSYGMCIHIGPQLILLL